jgi:hypothetical protein
MAAQATAIANIYEPNIWSKYFLEATTEKSLLIKSGIAGSDPELIDAATKGGRTVDMPFWDDLAHDTAATTRSKVATDTDDEITPAGVTSDKDQAVKDFRTQSFQIAPIIKYVAGDDPARMVVERFATWWAKEEQRLLLLKLTGAFLNSTVYGNLQNDISVTQATTNAANLISSDAIIDTQFKLGDAFQKLTGIIMHSVPFKRLCKLDLIDNVKESQQDPTVMPEYQGKKVLVDDGMTVYDGATYNKYYTYLFGENAVGRVDIPLETGDPNIELYRNPKAGTGAGMLDIISRRYMLLHLRGIKYYDSNMAGVSPSDAELIDPTNYTQVYLTKNIRIARLVTNG